MRHAAPLDVPFSAQKAHQEAPHVRNLEFASESIGEIHGFLTRSDRKEPESHREHAAALDVFMQLLSTSHFLIPTEHRELRHERTWNLPANT